MDQFFQCAELVSLDLVQGQEPFCPPARQFDGFYFFFAQSVSDSVLFDLPLTFLFCWVVAGVDDEVIFPRDADFLHVVLEDFFEVEVQSHKIAKRLLTQKSLCLHVNLSNRLAR